MVAGLKTNGVFLVEAYTPDQLKHGTGGGKSADLMTTGESLSLELEGLTFKHLVELERNVVGGHLPHRSWRGGPGRGRERILTRHPA